MRRANSKSSVHEPSRRTWRAAFSLVEVALALGIFAFVVVAILGLVSVSLNSSRDSTTDTVLSEMTQTVLTYLRSNPAPVSSSTNPSPVPSQLQGYTLIKNKVGTSTADTEVGKFYFDLNGQLARDTYGRPSTPTSGFVYTCTVLARPPSAAAGANASSLIYLQLQFRWPASQQVRIVNASIANYD